MAVVGLDFGTTNVRVAIWDPGQGRLPQPCLIGTGGTSTMPSVIAFQRHPRGGVSTIVGEEADELAEAPNTVVIRNIKRWALSSDPYFRWQLEARKAEWPSWWNPKSRCVNLWDQQLPVAAVIQTILDEALRRAGLEHVATWRAGCPTQTDLTYRQEMAGLISSYGGAAKVTWVAEEPILLLALAYTIGELGPGSYIVYDFGGGSFDCALATIDQKEGGLRLTVYAADGHPLLGGADIDQLLAQNLGYRGPPHQLRVAKERMSPNGPRQILPGGTILTWDHVENTLKQGRFFEDTIPLMMRVYRNAKLLWKRGDEAPPAGEVIRRDASTGAIRFVEELRQDDMGRDVDAVILFGGPTRSPYFKERLVGIFGPDKVVHISDLVSGLPDPELTGLTVGACYMTREEYTPLYIDRLPAKVTLRDINAGQKVQYEPFQKPTPIHPPFSPYVTGYLRQLPGSLSEYEVIVEDADSAVLLEHPVSGYLKGYSGLPADRLRVVIDRFGRVWVEKGAGKENLGISEIDMVMEEPPWQRETQREALRRLWEEQRKFELAEQERVHITITRNPFGWQSTPG